MMHPRLSVSEMCTYPLAVRRRARALGRARCPPGRVCITDKVDAFGRDAAIAALQRALDARDHGDHGDVRPVRPDELGRDPGGGQRRDRPRGRGRRVHVLHARPARRALVRRARGVAGRSGGAVREVRRVAGRAAGDRAVVAHRRVVRAHPPRRHRRRRARPASTSSPTSGTAGWNAIREDTVRRAGARIAVFQFSDAVFGTFERPVARRPGRARRRRPRARRVHPRRARRRVHRSVRARGRRARRSRPRVTAPRCDARVERTNELLYEVLP